RDIRFNQVPVKTVKTDLILRMLQRDSVVPDWHHAHLVQPWVEIINPRLQHIPEDATLLRPDYQTAGDLARRPRHGFLGRWAAGAGPNFRQRGAGYFPTLPKQPRHHPH